MTTRDFLLFVSLLSHALPLWVIGVLGNQVVLLCRQAVILASDPQAEEVLPESI